MTNAATVPNNGTAPIAATAPNGSQPIASPPPPGNNRNLADQPSPLNQYADDEYGLLMSSTIIYDWLKISDAQVAQWTQAGQLTPNVDYIQRSPQTPQEPIWTLQGLYGLCNLIQTEDSRKLRALLDHFSEQYTIPAASTPQPVASNPATPAPNGNSNGNSDGRRRKRPSNQPQAANPAGANPSATPQPRGNGQPPVQPTENSATPTQAQGPRQRKQQQPFQVQLPLRRRKQQEAQQAAEQGRSPSDSQQQAMPQRSQPNPNPQQSAMTRRQTTAPNQGHDGDWDAIAQQRRDTRRRQQVANKLPSGLWSVFLWYALAAVFVVGMIYLTQWIPNISAAIALLLLIGLPVGAIVWSKLTEPPVLAVPLLAAASYFFLLNLESVWRSLDRSNPSFLPKPFVNDGADPSLLFSSALWLSASFLIALFLSLVAQGLETLLIRAYCKIYLSRNGRLSHKRISAMLGFGVLVAYLLDATCAFNSYPLIGVQPGTWFRNFVYAIFSILGAEFCFNLALMTLDETSSDRDMTTNPDRFQLPGNR